MIPPITYENIMVFFGDLLTLVANFLMMEPVVWFVAVVLLLAVVSIVKKIIN